MPPRFLPSPTLRRLAVFVALILLPLLLGGWSWTKGPQSTFDTRGPVAESQLQLFYTTLWVTGVIFVLVAGVLAYATLKYRARNAADEHAAPPPQSHGNPLVELGLIAVSVLALIIIAVPTLHAIWFTYDVPETEKANAYEVNATGLQWWFRFEYPNETLDGAGNLVTGNELVIPAKRPVRINLRSADVIHSFWVPKLAGKVDMIPNRGNRLWLQADEPGYFWGQCAEFCGEDHAVMRFRVIALPEKEFADWLARQKQPARAPANVASTSPEPLRIESASFKFDRNAPGWSEQFDADPLARWRQMQTPETGENPALIARGRKLFQDKTCVSCHTVRGHEGAGVTSPDLTHVGARTTIAGGLLENNAANLRRWITDPHGVKPHNKMYMGVPLGGSVMAGYMKRDAASGNMMPNIQISAPEADALVAYLQSLK